MRRIHEGKATCQDCFFYGFSLSLTGMLREIRRIVRNIKPSLPLKIHCRPGQTLRGPSENSCSHDRDNSASPIRTVEER